MNPPRPYKLTFSALIDELRLSFIESLHRKSYRIIYYNLEQLPVLPDMPCIFVFNHGSVNDAPNSKEIVNFLRYKTDRGGQVEKRRISTKILAASDCLTWPFKVMFKIMDWISVDRLNPKEKKESINIMVKHLEKYDLIMWPEATWNVSSSLVNPFFDGASIVSYATNRPIYPIGWLRYNNDYYVNVGAPINKESITADMCLKNDVATKLADMVNNPALLAFKEQGCEKRLIVACEDELSSIIGGIELTKKIKSGLIALMHDNSIRDKLTDDLVEHIAIGKMTQTAQDSVASLIGEMVFDNEIQKPLARATFVPEKCRADILKKEKGYLLNYDDYEVQFIRKPSVYYSHILGKRRPL